MSSPHPSHLLPPLPPSPLLHTHAIPRRLENVHVCHHCYPKFPLAGNPFYDGLTPEQQRVEVLKKLPQVAKIDGVMVTPAERAEAGE